MSHQLVELASGNQLEKLKHELSKKFQSEYPVQDAYHLEYGEESEKISNAIKKIKFPYSMKDYLYYINEETANLLSGSSHAIWKEWGKRCKSFNTYNSLRENVEPSTGLVVAERGVTTTSKYAAKHPYQIGYSFTGRITWYIPNHSWWPSPDAEDGTNNHNTLWLAFNSLLPWVYAPKIAETPLELITPMHVAAMMGDIQLMQMLKNNGASLENDFNHWHVTPIELAIVCEQTETITYMLKYIDKNKAFKIAVEKGNFKIIELMINSNSPITDEILESSQARSYELYLYLEMKRKTDLQDKITKMGPLKALRSFLNNSPVPIQTIVDLICLHPEVVQEPLNKTDGNTLLHTLITENEVGKIKALMTAIFEAGLVRKDFQFDVEKKNTEKKTILDLALTGQNKDIIAAVMLYGDPDFTDHESVIFRDKIKLAAINRERTALMLKVIQKNTQMSLNNNSILMKNNYHIAVMAAKCDQLEAENESMRLALVRTQQELESCRNVLQYVCAHVGLKLSQAAPQPTSIPQIAMTSANPPLQLSQQSLAVPSSPVFFTTASTEGAESVRSGKTLLKVESKI